MSKTGHNPEDENIRSETLAERSARLEAEASGGFTRTNKTENPYSAEELPEFPPEPAENPAPAAPPENTGNGDEALRAELNAAKEQMMRALAEAENTRKRAAKEREDVSKYAITNFAREILSVADNLRRALDAIPAEAKGDGLSQGIEATERELLRILQKHGVTKIDPAGQPFNPHFHEVMFEVPASGKPAGTVIQVIETGYMLHDRLLRPARVGVAKDDGSAPPQGEPGGQVDTSA